MPNLYYNRFGHLGLTAALSTGSTLKALLLRSTGSYVADPDHDFVADLFSNGGVEITVASYGRQTLGTKVETLNDSANRSEFTSANISYGSLETGQTVAAIVYYKHVTNDADSILLSYHDGLCRVESAGITGAPLAGSITAATQANPVAITSNGHGLIAGDQISITGVVGMTQLNNIVGTVGGTITTNTFQLTGIDSTGYTAYASGGSWKQIKTIYTQRLRDNLLDGTSVSFGGVTGTVYGSPVKGDKSIKIKNLSALVGNGVTADIQTLLALPAALGGSTFTVVMPTDGLWQVRGGL